MWHRCLLAVPFVLLALSARAAETLVPAKMFSTADPGLEVTVWATSPMLRNPTNIDIDKDGRVWVAEGVNYRKHRDRQPAGDRIVVLEDLNRDGKADRSSTFVQEPFLRAPLGIAVVDNRIVVSMAPDLVVYTDVNRDRRFDPAVDTREVLLTGFNGRFHDHTLHSVTVGPDGQWYWNAGNAGAMFTDRSGKTFRIGGPYDPYYGARPAGDLGWDPREISGRKSDDGHVYVGGFAARMNPDGTAVRIIGHNFRNSYEQAVTSFGDVFQSDNDDPPACRTTFLLEHGNAGYFSADGRRTWEQGRRPGQSIPVAQWRQEDPGTIPAGDVYGGGAPTGMVFVEESALGRKYRGLLLSGEPARNVVFGYLPRPDGAGFALERFDFAGSNKEGRFAGSDYKGGDRSVSGELRTYFRPSDVAVGADGAVYVSDWFDPRVGGHNDMDDTLSGAIYRIAPRRFRPRVPKVDFTSITGALAALKSPAVNVRGAAFHALAAQGSRAVAPVAALLRGENPYVRARAIWLLARLGPEGAAKVEPLLADADAQTRVVAFRALRRRIETEGGDLAALARRLVGDPSPALRRELALAMRDLPFEQARDILVALARSFDGKDPAYLEAWGTGCTGKEAAMFDAISAALGARDPLAWTPAFERLAWRLHPEQSITAWQTRALAGTLSEAQRKAALTAIGQNATRAAALAMLDVATKAEGAVRGEAVWWLLGRKDAEWKPFGVTAELKRRGIYDEAKVPLASAAVPPPQAPTLTAQQVLSLRGDPARGGQIFAACMTCHRLGEHGVDYGPNLTGWAARQTAEVLAQSIVNPSADIAHGFGGHALETKEGVQIHGRIWSDADPLMVQSQGGVVQTVPRARLKSKRPLGRSLMLSAEEIGLDAQSVADVVAYLRSEGAGPTAQERRLLYVAVPGVRNYVEMGGIGVLVFDREQGYRFVKRIPTFAQSENVKGVAASAATGRLYVSTIKRVAAFDLRTDARVWEREYDGGSDRLSLSPDGKTLYVPSLEAAHWHIVDAATGEVRKRLVLGNRAHNTLYGLDGSRVYLEGLASPSLTVVDASTHAVVKTVGPFGASVRPFTVNGKQTLAFVNVDGLLGFEIGDLRSGKKLHRVEVKGYAPGPVKRHGCPSHGVGLTPDEREVWVSDAANSAVHVFDATVMPPRQIASVKLRDQPGWVTFSLDGSHAYPSTGEVIDVATRKIVATLADETGRAVQSEKMVEIVWAGDRPVRNGDQFGVGRAR